MEAFVWKKIFMALLDFFALKSPKNFKKLAQISNFLPSDHGPLWTQTRPILDPISGRIGSGYYPTGSGLGRVPSRSLIIILIKYFYLILILIININGQMLYNRNKFRLFKINNINLKNKIKNNVNGLFK